MTKKGQRNRESTKAAGTVTIHSSGSVVWNSHHAGYMKIPTLFRVGQIIDIAGFTFSGCGRGDVGRRQTRKELDNLGRKAEAH